MNVNSQIDWKKELLEIGFGLKNKLAEIDSFSERQRIISQGKTGDPQFSIDDTAEDFVLDSIKRLSKKVNICYFSEGKGLVRLHKNPDYLIIADPIDGSRPFSAGLENSNCSIAVAKTEGRAIEKLTMADVGIGILFELKNDLSFFAEKGEDTIIYKGRQKILPNPSKNEELQKLFWSFEFNGTPSKIVELTLGELIDASANKGGVFVFNSASYSISRVVSGQLHAYIDIGNLVLKKFPELESEFRRVGSGSVLHLFPYDIAAAYLIAKGAGVNISDAEGKTMENIKLLDMSPINQASCVCAANIKLHEKLVEKISLNLKNRRKEISEIL